MAVWYSTRLPTATGRHNHERQDEIMMAGTRESATGFEDPLLFLPEAITKLYSLWISATYPFASIGGKLSMHYTALLSRRIARRIKIGKSVAIRKDAWLNIIREASHGINITIEDNCLTGARNVISAKNHIHLERDVIMATSV